MSRRCRYVTITHSAELAMPVMSLSYTNRLQLVLVRQYFSGNLLRALMDTGRTNIVQSKRRREGFDGPFSGIEFI